MRARRKPTPFGQAVRIRLDQLNLQQKDLARMLGTSDAYITYLIYGDRRDSAWVGRICRALDMPLQEERTEAREAVEFGTKM